MPISDDWRICKDGAVKVPSRLDYSLVLEFGRAKCEVKLRFVPEASADGRQESVHTLQGLLGAVLLHEADGDDNDDGEGDGGGIIKLSHEQGDDGGGEEEQDERVVELLQVFLPQGIGIGTSDLIGCIEFSASKRLCTCHTTILITLLFPRYQRPILNMLIPKYLRG